ncbi:hypothetical protein V1264_012368 [Littorina saxatilis]|uniref:SGNH hydrolase-type esterase domain-containing protein n=1 Tax=Littorina saxatilis TaxID=31220 RepID=A0AAN9GNE9_9CAEN
MSIITRSKLQRSLEFIEHKKDHNEVTFTCKPCCFPTWRAVIRYRYAIDLPSRGYSTTWTDYKRKSGHVEIIDCEDDYSASSIVITPTPAQLDQTTVRLHHASQKLLTMHFYPKTNMFLVQGKLCQDWVRDDFQRLQGVVHGLMDLDNMSGSASHAVYSTVPLDTPPTAVNSSSAIAAATEGGDDSDISVSSDDSTVAAATEGSDNIVSSDDSTVAAVTEGGDDSNISVSSDDSTVAAATEGGDGISVSSDDSTVAAVTEGGGDIIVSSDDSTVAAVTEGGGDIIVSSDHSTVAAVTEGGGDIIVSSDHSTVAAVSEGGSDIVSSDHSTVAAVSEGGSDIIVSRDDSTVAAATEGGGDIIVSSDHSTVAAANNSTPSMDNKHAATSDIDGDGDASTDSTDTCVHDMLRAMVDKLASELRDLKVQTDRKIKANEGGCDREVKDLSERLTTLSRDNEGLKKRCQALESKVKDLQKENKTVQRSPSPEAPPLQQSPQGKVAHAQPISVTTNYGRYAHHSIDTALITEPEPQACSSQSSPSSMVRPRTTKSTETTDTQRQTTLRLPTSCTCLLIGDSNLRRVSRRRLDRSGQTEVRTLSGITTPQLTTVIASSNTFPDVRKIVLHVGTNDDIQNTSELPSNYKTLLSEISLRFPNAVIFVAAIPPQAQRKVTRQILQVNTKLASLCDGVKVQFLALSDIWRLDSDGQTDPDILQDKVHYSARGLSLLVKDIKAIVFEKRLGRASFADVVRGGAPPPKSHQPLQEKQQQQSPHQQQQWTPHQQQQQLPQQQQPPHQQQRQQQQPPHEQHRQQQQQPQQQQQQLWQKQPPLLPPPANQPFTQQHVSHPSLPLSPRGEHQYPTMYYPPWMNAFRQYQLSPFMHPHAQPSFYGQWPPGMHQASY